MLKPFREEAWAVAMRKGDIAMKAHVNAFLAKYRAGGGFRRLGDKWLKDQRETFAKLGVPFVF
jgi:polar amino acid transport system substrate-binding protein